MSDSLPHSLPAAKLRNLILRAIAVLTFLAVLLSHAFSSLAAPNPQTDSAEERARQVLSRMTPQEKIGQLFLVTFQGPVLRADSELADLINRYHIGGVVLRADHDNFSTGEESLNQILALNHSLQTASWEASQETRLDPTTREEYTPNFVPLFVAVSQEGDGYPYDQILDGMTPLPNNLAIGATWQPSLAREVGYVLGEELSALGINMLLGPSLDVLEPPYSGETEVLGTRSFGGDPYWVSRMGVEYVQGVQTGSSGQVAVIAKHFPGAGASDRLPEREVATIRRSLEQLRLLDLVPFTAISGNMNSFPGAHVDGLLVSHTRYQGFQGTNIRATTRPVSLDLDAVKQLMGVEPLSLWREQGGLLVSDDLGGPAIRRYYTSIKQTEDMVSRAALNAFLARNDLLYISDFSMGNTSNFEGTVRVLESFTKKYRDDPAFAPLVDESVHRILTLKFELYERLILEEILPSEAGLEGVGDANSVSFEVAQQAATLISPQQADLEIEIPDPPNLNDRIVFIVDTGEVRACSTCSRENALEVDALEDVVLHLYGPSAGGQVSTNYLTSFSLRDLEDAMRAATGITDIENELRRANWIVFAMLGPEISSPSYTALNQFLSERADLYQQKRLIVFAFGAPNYLDATNITKLTAYYGMYSKIPEFVDMAAYLLFRELRPPGAPPVSIPAVDYILNQALFPDPEQVISLRLDDPQVGGAEGEAGAATPVVPQYQIGDSIRVRTGVILDQNGHPVPDGTPVEFFSGLAGIPPQIETTVGGTARTTFQALVSGPMEIRAETETAKQSEILRVDIQQMAANGSTEEPAPEEPTPTPTAEPTITPTATLVPLVTLPPAVEPPPSPSGPELGDWIFAVLIGAAVGWVFYRMSALVGQVRWGVRGGFLALIGGLLAYSYLALEMPVIPVVSEMSISRAVLITTLAGTMLGLFTTWLWRFVGTQRR